MLVDDGVLIDTRPVSVPTGLEVSVRERWVTAFEFDVSPGRRDDEAVERAIESLVSACDLVRDGRTSFVSMLYWDSARELYAQAKEIGFRRFATPSDEALAKAEELMREAGPGARIRIQDKIVMDRYRRSEAARRT